MINLKSRRFTFLVVLTWGLSLFVLLRHLQKGIAEPYIGAFEHEKSKSETTSSLKGSWQSGTQSQAKTDGTNERYANASLWATPEMLDNSQQDWEPKRLAIKSMFEQAWFVYKKHAFGCDEILPMAKKCGNSFGNIGTTVIDSLDTLLLLGMEEEFMQGVAWISREYSLERDRQISVFETTIRNLGGLLSAYNMKPSPDLMNAAKKTGEWLLSAYETPSGIAAFTLGPNELPSALSSTTIADAGTQLLEHTALSEITSNSTFRHFASRGLEPLVKGLSDRIANGKIALLPTGINVHDNDVRFSGSFSMGPMGDSFYEYLLKLWIQGGKSDSLRVYRTLWDHAMNAMISELLVKDSSTGLYYLGDKGQSATSAQNSMHHLACFVPGMLALGAEGPDAGKYLKVAEDLAFTCWKMHRLAPTMLAPESVTFNGQGMMSKDSEHHLRPEIVESLFYLWRKTGDVKYREWAWDMAMSWNQSAKVESGGFSQLSNIFSGSRKDFTPSFFYAETLKYLYLIFSPSYILPLDRFVFNTEAHPFPILMNQG